MLAILLEGVKKEKHTDFGVLSCGVESEGFISTQQKLR
jgi:hypothetical protein